MKNSELKNLSVDELANKLAMEKEAYSKLTFAHAIMPIENPMKIRAARKLIARLETEVRAKQLVK